MEENTHNHGVKISTRWFLTIMMMIWTLFCGVILGTLTLGLIATPSRIDDLIGVWLAIIAAFIVAINYVTC